MSGGGSISAMELVVMAKTTAPCANAPGRKGKPRCDEDDDRGDGTDHLRLSHEHARERASTLSDNLM